ncbi:phosphodiester glycosidase family protein [Streptomyces sp. NPDC058745]|uniref:phosphodiester glycosidase family protein n=1 Tax=Streptomyces sp. NPDC058745 TaxID=3346621 RepID=UPI003679254F
MPRSTGRLPGPLLALMLLATTAACTTTDEPRPGVQAPTLPQARQLAPGVGYQEFTADGPTGPVRGHLLRIAPDAPVRLTGLYGRQLAEPQTVRDAAGRARALAAINASYFDIRGGRGFAGYPGDPSGLYVQDGRVLSESRNDAAALLIDHADGRTTARIAAVRTTGRITTDGAGRPLDGVNRVAGRLRPCPGAGRHTADHTPLTRDARTGLCKDPDEIVEFTADWGPTTPDGGRDTAEALLDAQGTVRELRSPAGGPLTTGGRTLYGIGDGAHWLRTHARPGTRVNAATTLSTPNGEPLPGTADTAIGGGARLLEDGRTLPAAPSSAKTDRPPRTVAGVTADGTVLLLVLDGREPGVSTGATLKETADLLRSLGAVDGLNLDGGGSSTMVVGDELVNSPRESTGDPVSERKVATALAILPSA